MENKHVSDEISSEWVQVQSPYSAESCHFIGDRDSIIITDDFFGDSSAFPPPNHEDLPITTPQNDDQMVQRSQESELTDDESTSPTSESIISKWKKSLNLGFLKSGITWIASNYRINVAREFRYSPLVLTVGGLASFIVAFVLQRRVLLWWRRRKRVNESNEHLMLLIRERDEKISQLLLQIAQMTQMLQARRKVPVIRVKKTSF